MFDGMFDGMFVGMTPLLAMAGRGSGGAAAAWCIWRTAGAAVREEEADAYIAMPYIVVADIVMAYIAMPYIVVADIVRPI